MAEITVTPFTFCKGLHYSRASEGRSLIFFFFLMTLTFWKTSPANKLVLSCLMWSEFLLGHVPPNSQRDAHFKNTNKPVWGFFFSFLFQIHFGSYGIDQKGRQEIVSSRGTGVRAIIWGALGHKEKVTQISDVCIPTLSHLWAFLVPSRMSGLVQSEGGTVLS